MFEYEFYGDCKRMKGMPTTMPTNNPADMSNEELVGEFWRSVDDANTNGGSGMVEDRPGEVIEAAQKHVDTIHDELLRRLNRADGRIGVLPTRSELMNAHRHKSYTTAIDALIATGYAREDDEPMTTPDPNSAAVDAIADILARRIGRDKLTDVTRAILDYLREHPEHGPWPVMTASEALGVWNRRPTEDELHTSLDEITPVLVIPDPPAASVPSVLSDIEALYRRAVAREKFIQQEYRKGSDPWNECERNLSGLKDIRQRLIDCAANGDMDTRLVEDANGGGDHE